MEIKQINPQRTDEIRQFIDLPFTIYQDNPQWVPPLSTDSRRIFDLDRNPFYKEGEAAFFLALSESGRPAGRIAIINNHKYNGFNRESTAFFYLFECIDKEEIALGLFDSAIRWAMKRGLNKIIGPKGFTVFDGLGLLVAGFEYRPAFGLPYNPEYYSRLIESAGFTKESELVSGYLDHQIHFPERILELGRRLSQRRGLFIKEIRTRRDLRLIIPHLKNLYNSSLGETTGTYPLSDEEVESLANQMLWFADPRLIKIVMREETPVGFLFAYPDISAAVQKIKGKVFPLGWIRLLLELKRTQWININGAGLIEQYRGSGGTALLFSEMYNSVLGSRYKYADIVQIGVDNDRMQREMANFGINFYKKHRLYCRSISPS